MCKSSLAQGVEKVEPYSVFAPALPVVICANMPGEMFTEACLCIPDSTRCSYTDKICVHTLTTNCSGTASTHDKHPHRLCKGLKSTNLLYNKCLLATIEGLISSKIQNR